MTSKEKKEAFWLALFSFCPLYLASMVWSRTLHTLRIRWSAIAGIFAILYRKAIRYAVWKKEEVLGFTSNDK